MSLSKAGFSTTDFTGAVVSPARSSGATATVTRHAARIPAYRCIKSCSERIYKGLGLGDGQDLVRVGCARSLPCSTLTQAFFGRANWQAFLPGIIYRIPCGLATTLAALFLGLFWLAGRVLLQILLRIILERFLAAGAAHVVSLSLVRHLDLAEPAAHHAFGAGIARPGKGDSFLGAAHA